MENFFKILESEEDRICVYLNQSNPDLLKKFNELNRSEKLIKQFVLVIKAVSKDVHTKQQYNFEGSYNKGRVYAIKVKEHRFYTWQQTRSGFLELFIYRYGKKGSQKNTKKLTDIIKTIDQIEIQIIKL